MRLTTRQKIRSVQLYAERLTPTEITAQLKLEFPELADARISLTTIQRYNPTLCSGRNLSKPLRAIFYDVRKRFDKLVVETTPESRDWRIRELSNLIHKNRTNAKLCAALMQQVAREVGDMYTKKGGPAEKDGKGKIFEIMDLPIEEKARRIREILEEGERLADLAEQSGLSRQPAAQPTEP
jgi:hypothetical protein